MGKVIAFPVPPTLYTDRAADLGAAQGVLPSAIRCWAESYPEGEDPIPRLCDGLDATGALEAAFSIDGLMILIARAVIGPIDLSGSH